MFVVTHEAPEEVPAAELTIELVPVILGGGISLLGGLDPGAARLELIRVVDAPGVTHLTYDVTYGVTYGVAYGVIG